MSIQVITQEQQQRNFYYEVLEKLIKMPGNILIISNGYMNSGKEASINELREEVGRNLTKDIITIPKIAHLRENYEDELLIVILCNSKEDIEKYEKSVSKFILDRKNIRIEYKLVENYNCDKRIAIKLSRDGLNDKNNKYYGAFIENPSMYIVNDNLVKNNELYKISTIKYGVAECYNGIRECDNNIVKISEQLKKVYSSIDLPDISKSSLEIKYLKEKCIKYNFQDNREYNYALLLGLINQREYLEKEIEFLQSKHRNIRKIYEESLLNRESSYITDLFNQLCLLNDDFYQAVKSDNDNGYTDNWLNYESYKWFDTSKAITSCINKINRKLQKEIDRKFTESNLLNRDDINFDIIIESLHEELI